MSRLLYYYYIKKFVTFAPTPLFLIFSACGIVFSNMPICGAQSYEMSIMWFLMALAHSRVWIEWWEIKKCPKGCGCHRD